MALASGRNARHSPNIISCFLFLNHILCYVTSEETNRKAEDAGEGLINLSIRNNVSVNVIQFEFVVGMDSIGTR